MKQKFVQCIVMAVLWSALQQKNFASSTQTLRSKDALEKYDQLSYILKTSKFIPLRQKNALIGAEVT
jgi:hypothetical protein